MMSIMVFTEYRGQSWLSLEACLWLLRIKKNQGFMWLARSIEMIQSKKLQTSMSEINTG